jgi:hypothetical protein
VALPDRLGAADEAVRRQPLVAGGSRGPRHGLLDVGGCRPGRPTRRGPRNVVRAQGRRPRQSGPAQPDRPRLEAAAWSAGGLGDWPARLRAGLRGAERPDQRTEGRGDRVVRHLRR